MANDLKKRVAARLRLLIGENPIIELGPMGGPSRSYVYRILNEQNVSIEVLDAVLRAYGSNLGDFFEPWKEESKVKRQTQAAKARQQLDAILAHDELDLGGLLYYLDTVSAGLSRQRTRKKPQIS